MASFTDTPVADVKRTNTLETLFHTRPRTPLSSNLPVLKMRNIPFDVSIQDILSYFDPIPIPMGHKSPFFTQGVHILMNRSTGKTLSECFIEFATVADAQAALELQASRRIIKGREVSLVPSTQKEFMAALFACFAISDLSPDNPFLMIRNVSPTSYSQAASPLGSASTFLTRDDIQSILTICKNYKLHFSRKCAERPFEFIITILSKMPWQSYDVISLLQRDHIFEMLKIALESLMGHLSKDLASHFDASLMFRLIRAGLCVPLFTEKQKLVLLNIGRVSCPQDLAPYVFYPEETQMDEQVLVTPVQATNAGKELTASYPTPSSADSPLTSRNKTLPVSNLTSDDFFKDWRKEQERQSYELKIKDLETQLVASQRATSQLTKEIQGRDQELSLLKGQNIKMKGRLTTFKAVIQSLERRNAELEYANLTKKTASKGGHWGSQGLWMEYQTWEDAWNIPEH